MKGTHPSVERRLESRCAFLAGQLVMVDLISASPAFRTRGIVLDLSKGGMAVQTSHPLVPRRSAEIRLSFPNVSLPSMGAGLVAWQKPGGLAGIRFLNAPLKNLPEPRQLAASDDLPSVSDSARPLFAYRSNSGNSEFGNTLHLFACSVMALTGATGAAIAIGDCSGMECRASVGCAPEVGARLFPDSGLSGHSLRTGAVNLCDDGWADPRVNTAAARQINARSIVIIPITRAGDVVGLLEAFSAEINHFDERHVKQLLPLVKALTSAPELEAVPPQAIGATIYDEPLAPAEPTHLPPAHPRAGRTRRNAIATGVVAVLLVFMLAIALLVFRGNGNFSVGTRNNAWPSNSSITGQGINSNVKPEITFSPPVINQTVGATFGVDVVLKGASNVVSVPLQILYDPEKLELIRVTNGGLLNRDGQAAALVQRDDSEAGRVNVSISRPAFAPGISGDGTVFTLIFLTKAQGRSTLRMSQTSLRDRSAKIVPVDSSDALITISKSAIPANDQSMVSRRSASNRTVP